MGKVGEGGNGRRRLVALLLVGGLAAVLAAGPPTPVTPGAEPVEAQLSSAADEARLIQAVEESLARKKELDARVAELDGRLGEAQSELRAAQARLGALVSRQRTTETKLEETRQQLAGAEQALRDQAIAAYTGRSDAGRIVAVLRSSDMAVVANRQSYLRAVAGTQADAVVNHERLRDQTDDLLAELAVEKEKAEAERNVVSAKTAAIQSDRDAQAAARHQVSVEIANHDLALQEIIHRQGEFEAQARELEVQSAAVAEALGRRQQFQPPASSSPSGGRLGPPLASVRVSSAFGWRVHPVFGNRRMHTGADLSASTGTPIQAAAEGVVVSAGWMGGYGNATVIDHGGGLATLYAHQSAVLVSPGQRVSRGQVVGRVGCTGTCTGPHLHYEVRVNGSPVDPAPYL